MRYILLFIVLAFYCSCSPDEDITLQIGEDYVASNTKVYFIDSLTVNASTIQFDSLIVSYPKRLLIGAYNDPTFGVTQSRSFIQLENHDYGIDNDAIYDSIALTLYYDNYFYNDTIPNQQFKIFEVLDDIKPEESSYYNTTNFNYNNTPIAVKDFSPKPYKNDSLFIKIDDAFGASIFNKIKDDDINNLDEFLDEYKGLMVAANESSNTSILGFAKHSLLRIYYSLPSEEEIVEKTIDFSFNTANTFNQTTSNQTGTFFETIIDQETILQSKDTDNSSFIQSGTGITTRIDIPYIKLLNDIPGDGVIIDAKLSFSIKQNSFSDNLYTRDTLYAFIIDKKANVVSKLTIDGAESIIAAIVNDNPEFDTDIYEMDIKNFIDIKNTETHEEFYLAIYPRDFNNSTDRYIFNGEDTSNDLRMKLELTYAVYD